jgi:hypothetical protein
LQSNNSSLSKKVKTMNDTMIHIPATVEGMMQAAKARAWERAAWVWAYQDRYTAAEFAALGINGLRTSHRVEAYRRAWQSAIDSGHARPVEPGNIVAIPQLPWAMTPDAENPNRVGGEEMAARYAEEARLAGTTLGQAIRAGASKKAIAAAVMADSDVERAVREALIAKEMRDQPCDLPQPSSHSENHVHDEWIGLVLKLESAKRSMLSSLEMATSFAGNAEKRLIILETTKELRSILNAIDVVAQGSSLDSVLASILGGAA